MDNADTIRAMIKKQGFALLSKTDGSSMRPLLWGGRHTVAVAPLCGDPSVGDILLFVQRRGDKEVSIVHRLVGISETEIGKGSESNAVAENDRKLETSATKLYIMRGDNCIGCEKVRREEIIGRVVEIHRISGWRPWHIIPKKKIEVTDRYYRLYSRVWMAIWPLRRIYYALRARLRVRGER